MPLGRWGRGAVCRAVAVAACVLSWPTPAGQLQRGAHCADKRSDCGLYAGNGPKGGGCENHAEYMRVFCRQTCGFCDAADVNLSVERLTLAGTPVDAVSSRGARRWLFFELPVVRACGRLPAGPAADSAADPAPDATAAGGAEGSCASGAGAAAMRTHAAMAHYYDSQSHVLNSSIFRWDAGAGGFVEHQAVPTVGAWGMAALELGGAWYLAVASFFDGTRRELNSTVLRWDVGADAFVPFQLLETVGAMDVEAVVAHGSAILIFTGSRDSRWGGADAAESRLFRWTGDRFELFQTIATPGCYDAEAFAESDGTVVLLLVHERATDVYSASWQELMGRPGGPPGGGFARIQSLDVPHGRDAEHFSVNGTHFLALAVFRDAKSYATDSLVYAWAAAARRFEEVQRLGTNGAFDIELLTFPNEEYRLMVANQRPGTSALYSWRSGAWQPSETFSTRGVYDVSWHFVREASAYFLGIARYWE